jgi:flavin-binding protein dodecin
LRIIDQASYRINKEDKGINMADHTYKKIEIVGSSPEGYQKAIENAIAKASETLHNMRWFEVVETRGQIEESRIAHWQVTLKIGFTLDA